MHGKTSSPEDETAHAYPWRVVLVGLYRHSGRMASIALYLRVLQEKLEAQGISVEVLVPPLILGRCSKFPAPFRKAMYALDKLLLFPLILRSRIRSIGRDNVPFIVHIVTEGHADCVRYLKHVPHLVTCHDVLPLRIINGEVPHETTSWQTRAYWRLQLGGFNRARHVACVSEQTRRDLLRFSTLKGEQVSVIPNALNYPYEPMEREEARTRITKLLGEYPEGGFFLQVGRNAWYKNRMGGVKIFAGLRKAPGLDNPHLISIGPPFNGEIHEYLRLHDLADCAKTLHNIDEEDLRACYSLAEGLIFPSFAEGFGWPVIEAQACGCPVFASNRSPMTDVAGDGAVYFDPEHTDEAVEEILRHWDRRGEMRTQGLENVTRFSAKGMAEAYVRLYGKLVEEFQDR